MGGGGGREEFNFFSLFFFTVVTEATGQVVASSMSGSELSKKGSAGEHDYTKLSLTQAKRLEMESQVKALLLEKELRDERTKLAELRKAHYHLAGASEGWEVRIGREEEGGGWQ